MTKLPSAYQARSGRKTNSSIFDPLSGAAALASLRDSIHQNVISLGEQHVETNNQVRTRLKRKRELFGDKETQQKKANFSL